MWLAYTFLVAQQLLAAAAAQTRPDTETTLYLAGEREGVDLLRAIALGVQALAQHYGPGSQFLDVTHAPEVGVWFALHDLQAYDVVAVPTDPSQLIANPDLVRGESFVRYARRTAGPGWLYVFDVPRWDGARLPRHGELVDLGAEDAPTVLTLSERIRVQRACLIRAEASSATGGDLTHLCTSEPIAVDWPMDDLPGRDASTNAMFPDLDADAWYEMLLGIPKAPQVDPADLQVKVERALPVTIYGFDDHEKHGRILETLRTVDILPRNSALATLRADREGLPATWPAEACARIERAWFKDAVRILLEGPVLASSPPADSGLWNVPALVTGIAASVGVTDLATPALGGLVSTENVFVQFSPLEWTAWPLLARGHHIDLVRGAWLIRTGSMGVMYLFDEHFPESQITVSVPICFQFEPSERSLQFWFGGQWLNATGRGKYDQPLLVTLDILRKVSPGVKASPLLAGGVSDGVFHLEASSERGPILKLCRAGDSEDAVDWHVLRTVGTNEPYTVAKLMLRLG